MTYYSVCRVVGHNFNECPNREAGQRCINCGNLLWVLRKKEQKPSENTDSEATSEEKNKNSDK